VIPDAAIEDRGTARPVVVGSASRDVAVSDPRGWRLGGAAAYAGLTLARLGLRPRVLLGLDDLAASAAELDLLRAAGAELRAVRLRRGPVFDNREVDGVREQLCLEPGESLPVEAVPAAWRDARAWLLGPVAGELSDAWAALPPEAAFVALGWQGLLRDLSRGGPVRPRPPRPSAILSRADLVVASRLDLPPGAVVADFARLLRPGATLVVTDGHAGGSAWRLLPGRRPRARAYPAVGAGRVLDATGAGDAFLAGLVAARLGHPLGGSGRRGADLRLGAVLGSFTVEGPGLEGVPTQRATADRLRESLRRT
jgi:sugar/nucleoside kinase (ribokinase family)